MKLFGVMTAAVLLPGALSAQELAFDRDAAWFKPALLLNEASVCADLLQVEQDAFFTTASKADHERPGFKLIRKMYEEAVPDPRVEIIPDSLGQLKLTRPGEQPVIVYFHNNGGCGGGCETEQVMVSDKVFDPLPSRGHDLPATPLAPGWTLYKSEDGAFYALGYPEANLQVYRVMPARAEMICEVKLQPSDTDKNDEAVRSASRSLERFLMSLAAMSQGAGECGTLRAHWRRQRRAAEAAEQALYRPWGSETWQRGLDELNSDADSWSEGGESIDFHLGKWAMSGVAELRAFDRYWRQYELTVMELRKFYQRKFGWSEDQADDGAVLALQGILERAFAFSSSYDRFGGGQALRQAILERRTLEDIDELYEAYEREAETLGMSEEDSLYDSLLNVAIEYPEALQYLLDRGLDPNAGNDFGKTPLMYAAQYDQLESARRLLEAGANPNLSTHLPQDTCFYTLRSSGVTALHYAVRYASVPLIRLLVAEGAATSSKAYHDRLGREGHPIDWLETFTERSRTAEELAPLRELLRVPDDKGQAP